MSTLEQAIAAATNAITGNSGGYVVLRPAKNPQEILIMDTPNINTAKKVWRWNSGGLGYSSNGYNGPFALAMTNDGQIVANRITSGILNANIIKAGIIRSSDSSVYFDLDSGILSASRLTAKTGTGNAYLSLTKVPTGVSYDFFNKGSLAFSMLPGASSMLMSTGHDASTFFSIGRYNFTLNSVSSSGAIANMIIGDGQVNVTGSLYVNGRRVVTE